MKVIILAAGIGSRLGVPLPKALIPIQDDKTILHHQIDGLLHYLSIKDIFVVVGYKKNLIIDAFPDLSFIDNPRFSQTNTSKSLLIAINKLIGNEILWLNGDVYFDHNVIERIIHYNGNCMAVNRAIVGLEEVKYKTNKQGYVVEISKEVEHPEGESLGIHKISSNETNLLKKCLSNCHDQDYFEKGLELSIQNGMQVKPIDISDLTCIEIDFVEDLAILNDLLNNR